MKEINAMALNARLSHGDPLLLIDVREPWELDICRIAGAQSMPMKDIPKRHQELDKDREIVVICHHGMRSAQAASYLGQLGFTKVTNLAGGIDAWAREVDLSMATY